MAPRSAAACRASRAHLPRGAAEHALPADRALHRVLRERHLPRPPRPGALPLLPRDLAAGRLDYEPAKELLACFILKIDEVIFLSDGDSFLRIGKLFETLSTVETVTVGGVGEDGNDATNDVTYMILDICELRPIGVNMAARIHQDSPAEYVERIAEVYLNGSPMPALYNDDVYIDSAAAPLPDRASRTRATTPSSAAWSPSASRRPLRQHRLRQHQPDHALPAGAAGRRAPPVAAAGARRPQAAASASPARSGEVAPPLGPVGASRGGRALRPPASMEELMARFQARTNEVIAAVLADHARIEAALCRDFTTPLASSLYEGCIESGQVRLRGRRHHQHQRHPGRRRHRRRRLAARHRRGGLPPALCTMAEVLRALDADFEGEHQGESRRAPRGAQVRRRRRRRMAALGGAECSLST